MPSTQFSPVLQNKQLEAQIALYRGFLHEVNNALAGIGSLAEALKGSGIGTLDSSLDLIAKTAARSADLQRRLRALFSGAEILPCDLNQFLSQNKDLLELQLPRSQKIILQLSSTPVIVKISSEKLWRFISIILLWAKESGAKEICFQTCQRQLSFNVFSLNETWKELLEGCMDELEATLETSDDKLAILFR